MNTSSHRLQSLQRNATLIKYASVLPATGKTRWAITQMLNRIVTQQGLMLYVAPTIKLLQEVRDCLLEKLNAEQRERVFLVDANDSEQKTATIIYGVMHGTPDEYGRPRTPAPPGTVLLITHEAFLRLSHGNKKDGQPKFPLRPKIDIIFDEARKCAAKSENFRIPLDVLTELKDRYIILDGASTGTAYKQIRLRSRIDTAGFSKLFNTSKHLRRLGIKLLHLFEELKDPAMQMFATIRADTSDAVGDEDEQGPANMVLQTVLVPWQIFNGWHDVTLLSAFFEDSQMFHLLRTRDVSARHANENKRDFAKRIGAAISNGNYYVMLQNVTDEVVDAKRVQAVMKRYSDTTIAYISPNVSFGQKHLQLGVMVDSKLIGNGFDFDSVFKRYKKLANVRQSQLGGKPLPLRVAALSDTAEAIEADAEINKLLKTVPGLVRKYTPLQWYVKSAIYMSRKWYAKHKMQSQVIPITVNVGKDGRQVRKNRHWMREVTILADVPEQALELPMQAHGLNCYKHLHSIAFLATLNPNPNVVNLFRQLCPDYNPQMDHTLDQCIQIIARCSLRDTTSKHKPLVIVTDKPLAEKVRTQLLKLPTVLGPEAFELPAKDPVFYSIEVDYAEVQRERRANTEVREREKLVRERPEAKAKLRAWITYLTANSEAARLYGAQSTNLSRMRKDGLSASAEFKKKTEQFEKTKLLRKQDIAVLRPEFNRIYKVQ